MAIPHEWPRGELVLEQEAAPIVSTVTSHCQDYLE